MSVAMAKCARGDEVLTIKAAAEILGVSEQTLRRWDNSGKLRARRHPINGYRLYPRKVVQDLKRRIESGSSDEVAR